MNRAFVDGLTVTLMREGINKHRAKEIATGYWEAYFEDDVADLIAQERERLERDNAALRELMNIYNLGGWTDSERLMKERDEARRERDTAIAQEREACARECEAVRNEWRESDPYTSICASRIRGRK